ncbi:MAG: NADH-quinone oxidoreductase subunit M [Chthoniobacterales bacterium]
MSPLLYTILIPVIAAILIAAGAPARRTAGFATFINLLWALSLFALYRTAPAGIDHYKFVHTWPVLPQFGLNFTLGADGLTLVMLLLATLVSVCAVWASPKVEKAERAFFISILMISAGVIGAFVSVDVFFFYAFHELALIPTFLLIGIWGSGDRQAAAWKATIYLALGSFVLLIGIIGLYLSIPVLNHRTFDMRALQDLAAHGGIEKKTWVYFLLLFGFGTLISLFPFHSWAPQAYSSAPAPAAMLHAGVLKKFGLYGLLRLVVPIFPETMQTYMNLLLVLLLCNIIYVGLITVAQKKLDWMLGYSSVMHMGYIFLGVAGAGMSILSYTGAAILMFAHGLSIAALFALTGQLRERTGTLEMSQLGGLARKLPVFGLLFGFATMAGLGLPGFANFAGEILVFFGAFGTAGVGNNYHALNNYQIATIIALWGVVISAVYMLRAYRNVFLGQPGVVTADGALDLSGSARLAITLLIIGLMIIGFYPQLFIHYLAPVWH